jgi:hypothetical protein
VEASALHAPSAPGRIPGPGPLVRLRADEQLIALFRKGHDEGSRKHVRDCAACREYKDRLRGLDRALGGAAPRHGAFAAIAKLLGIGGAGSGVAVGAGTVAVGGPVAAKIIAAPAHATRTATPTPPAAVLARVDRRVPAAAAPVRGHRLAPAQPATRPRPTVLGTLRDGALSVHRAAPRRRRRRST